MHGKRPALIGLAFLVCLMLSYYANTFFFRILNISFQNPLLFFLMILINNITVISLILLGMTFYVSLVISNFFKREEYAYIVLDHPRAFAIVFALVIILLSILRGANLFLGRIIVEALPLILLVSAPIAIIEGYGIYFTIQKTLRRTMSLKDLVYAYGIFLVAALVEVSFIHLLTM